MGPPGRKRRPKCQTLDHAARARSRIHLDLMDDMKAIAALTLPGDRVMWVSPAHIALLAGRRGIAAPPPRAPEDYLSAVRAARPDFVFLSAYHPRDTIRDDAWRAGMAALAGQGEAVHARKAPDGRAQAVLLRLREPR